LKVLDVKVTEVIAGDICAIIGVGFEIGDTIADHETQKVCFNY
jgi:translation elongation factor EF-G